MAAPTPATGSKTEEAAERDQPHLPADALIILPLRHIVLFPGVVMPLSLKHALPIAAAQAAAQTQQPFGAVLQLDPEVETPTLDQLHKVGTIANVLRYVTAPDGTHQVGLPGPGTFSHPRISGRLSASHGEGRTPCRDRRRWSGGRSAPSSAEGTLA